MESESEQIPRNLSGDFSFGVIILSPHSFQNKKFALGIDWDIMML